MQPPDIPQRQGFTCPICQYQGFPLPKQQLSVGGWVLFAVLVLFCIPFCWLPFILDGCKETTYHCPSCRAKLA